MKPYDNSTLDSNLLLLPKLSWLLNFQLPICESWRQFLKHLTQASCNKPGSNDVTGSGASYRYLVNWLELTVNQQGMVVDNILTKSRHPDAAEKIVTLLNDFFGDESPPQHVHQEQMLRFEYVNQRFYLQTNMALPSHWPNAIELYKQNLMSLLGFDKDKQWLVLLNEVQMLLGQQLHELDGVLINGFWPDFEPTYLSEVVETSSVAVVSDDDGFYYAMKNDFAGLESWLKERLEQSMMKASQDAEFVLSDGTYVWRNANWRKLMIKTKHWTSRVL